MSVKKLQVAVEFQPEFKDYSKIKDKFAGILNIDGLDKKLKGQLEKGLDAVGKDFGKVSQFKPTTENLGQYEKMIEKLQTDYAKLEEVYQELQKSMAQPFETSGLKRAQQSVENYLQSLSGQKDTTTSKEFKKMFDGLGEEAKNQIGNASTEVERLTLIIDNLKKSIETEEQTDKPDKERVKTLTALKGQLTAAEKSVKNYKNAEEQAAKSQENANQQVANGAAALQGVKQSADDANDSLKDYEEQAKNATAKEAADNVLRTVKQFAGFQIVVQKVKKEIKQLIATYQELDKSLTTIASVTGKTRDEMWGMVGTFNEMAQRLGTTTNNIVQASTLYYQQGRSTAEVLALVEQTSALASISGLDYAEATNKMTTAINGFNIAAEDSITVVDTWANLAANTAVSVEELATAISKVASLASNAGMSMESTSAFLSQMIATTREAPENLGTALKLSA